MPKKKNYGKRFEEDFKNSVDESKMIVEREKDSMAFNSRGKNPYDFRIYHYPNIFFFELKSTGSASVSLQKNIVRTHQIEELRKRKKYKGVFAGFLLEFREKKLKTKTREHKVYYLDIDNFLKKQKGKKSLSIDDVKSLGGIEVEAHKKVTRYTMNINKLIKDIRNSSAKTK